MNDLMIMMKSKYCILCSDDCVRMGSDSQITLHKVVFSYPSIIFGMFYYKGVTILNFLSKILFNCDLTNIYCSWLASIIPVLEIDKNTPLALLLAMIVVLDRENKPSYVLYQQILTLYTF